MIPFWKLDSTDRDAMVEHIMGGNDHEDLTIAYLERYSREELTILQAEIDLQRRIEDAEACIKNLAESTYFIPDDLQKVLIALVQRERLRIKDETGSMKFADSGFVELGKQEEELNALLEHLKHLK
jgi:hypothetical protein